MKTAVLQAGKIAPGGLQKVPVDFRDDRTVAAGLFRQLVAPGVHDHAVAPGLAAADVEAALGSGEHEAEIFDGAGTQQGVPVGGAGHGGEGRGQGDQFHALVQQRTVHFREAQVVTDGKTELAERRVHHAEFIAGFDGFRFHVLLVGFHQVDIEQVHLVVAGDPLSLVVVQQAGGA